MKIKVVTLDNKTADKELELLDDVFGYHGRPDIIKRVIDWQRAKARSGCHKTKTVTEVSGTTKKPFKQKGTGNARQGSLRSVQMRGGGISHGPRVRTHNTDLPKKVRRLGLICAMSERAAEGKLIVVDNANLKEAKTKLLNTKLENFNGNSFFIIDAETVDKNLLLAAGNLPHVNVVPQIGANVYDIIKHEYLILTLDAVKMLEKRLAV